MVVAGTVVVVELVVVAGTVVVVDDVDDVDECDVVDVDGRGDEVDVDVRGRRGRRRHDGVDEDVVDAGVVVEVVDDEVDERGR